MYYLLIEKFNNYNNRFLKRFDTIQEYVDYCTENSLEYSLNTSKDTNFNKRDNIHASHVFNENMDPSYLIWFDKTSGDIVSRWFVIHYTHLSGTQFMAELKRDVLADNKEEILESPCYIEKGFVPDNDPAIFNKEDILVNQIKKKEALIRDFTKCAWIVGYCAPGIAQETTITYNNVYDLEVNTSFENWTYYSLCNAGAKQNIDRNNEETRVYFNIERDHTLIRHYGPYFYINNNTHYVRPFDMNYNDCWILADKLKLDSFIASEWWANISWSTVISRIYADNPSFVNDTTYNLLLSLDGKKVKFTDGIYTFTATSSQQHLEKIYSANDSSLYNYLYTQISATLSGLGTSIASVYNYPVNYDLVVNNFSVTAVKDETAEGTYTSSMKSTHKNLQDAPYRMFVIPYPVCEDVTSVAVNSILINKELSFSWAIELIKSLGSNLYDIQLLPFFPDYEAKVDITESFDIITRTYTISLSYNSSGSDTVDFMYLKDSNSNNKNIAIFFEKSTFSNYLNVGAISDIVSLKECNELDLYRICSPNYSSSFEFNPAKNNKNRTTFITYCTYKPYQPFIYIAPKFYDLYGKDFKDNRGLILSGDFSLPIITSAWTQYQLNNKNYLLMFDRQIESLELQQDWQYKQGLANAITGTLKGGTTGGMAGGMVGGPWGAVAGAVVGTVASGVGGVMDLTMQKELQRDAKDYAKDNFRMSIQNIKALPYTLNKVSSLVATSKIFPFLEYYSCTDTEREAFRKKLKYNGYTIERIGFIKDFLNPSDTTFIKAKLIRNETITCNADELLEISNELNKGVFIE